MEIKFILEKIVDVIEGIAILVAIWGVILIVIEFIREEVRIKNKEERMEKNIKIKNHLASYVLLAFEILIAADVILSIIKPTLKELSILAALVIIRTFITYFLNKELKESGKKDKLK